MSSNPVPEFALRRVCSPEEADSSYTRPSHTVRNLPAGWKLAPEHAAFDVDTIWERDIDVVLRDGVKILLDVFRPEASNGSGMPALIAWSPYGKAGCRVGGFDPVSMIPGRVGVPKNRLSGLQKFEAPDPAEWTGRGYAIVNVDSRGTYDSEGNILHFGEAEGRDGYDVVEAIAQMPWCDGNVGLVGNSWLAIAQWFIAAEQPPHLKCIAPLEGASDFYREILCRGGIPQTPFWDFLSGELRGRNTQEDVVGMLDMYPLINKYWGDKRAKLDKITVPAYVLASFSSFLHTFGSFRGFTDIPHDKKWLRVHPHQEWYDLYQKTTNNELQLFFDKYLKGLDNKWEDTPKVRLSVLRYDQDPHVNIPFPSWPLPNVEYETLFLNAERRLVSNRPAKTESLSYQSDVPFMQMDSDPEELLFTYNIDHKCTFVGNAQAILFMSCPDADDMDVFVQLRKANKTGKILQQINIPLADRVACETPEPLDPTNPVIYLGPSGCLRASHRKLDPQLSTDTWPEHDFSTREPINKPGEIVRLEIGLWHSAIAFEPGEKLVLKVSGHNMTLVEFPQLRGQMPNFNKGAHYVHVGGEYASSIMVPFLKQELPVV